MSNSNQLTLRDLYDPKDFDFKLLPPRDLLMPHIQLNRYWEESFIDGHLKPRCAKLSNPDCMTLIDHWYCKLVTGVDCSSKHDFLVVNTILAMQLRDPRDLTKFVFDAHLVQEGIEYEGEEYCILKHFDVKNITEEWQQKQQKLRDEGKLHNTRYGIVAEYINEFCGTSLDKLNARTFYVWLKKEVSGHSVNGKIALCAFIAFSLFRIGVQQVSTIERNVRDKFHLDFNKYYRPIAGKPGHFPPPKLSILEHMKKYIEPGSFYLRTVLAPSVHISEHLKVQHLRPLLSYGVLMVYELNGLAVIENYLAATKACGLHGEAFIARFEPFCTRTVGDFGGILRKYVAMMEQGDQMWALPWSRAIDNGCNRQFSKKWSGHLWKLLKKIELMHSTNTTTTTGGQVGQ